MWEPTVPAEADDLEGQQADEEHDRDASGPAIAEEAGHPASVASRSRATWLAAAVLALAAIGLGAFLLVRGPGSAIRQRQVEDVAERFALALSSYDYHHLDRDLARVRGMGVGNFRYQYEQILGGTSFQKALRNNQAVATAKVARGPFVASLGNQDARTFTVLSQRIQGRASPQPETRKVRVESVLVRTADGWKVDWVEIT